MNTPVQGTAADGFKAALVEFWHNRNAVRSAKLVLAVHDELVLECDCQDADAAADLLRKCLVAGMQR